MLSNPIPDCGARFPTVSPERTVGRSDRRTFDDLCTEEPMKELCSPVHTIRPRLVGRETGLFEQGEVVCRVKEREREAGLIFAAVFGM